MVSANPEKSIFFREAEPSTNLVFFNEILSPVNLPTAYLPEQFHSPLHDIDRINTSLTSQSFTSHSVHSTDAFVTQSANKIKRVGNSVVYPRMLRKIKSDEQILFTYLRQESRSRSGPRDTGQLRKIHSESVQDEDANNGMWVMDVREDSRRSQRAQHIFKRPQVDSGRKVSHIRTNPNCPKPLKKPPLNRKLRWLIPGAPVSSLSRVERETDLLAFNFIPSASKFAFPGTFEDLMGNESSTKVILTVIHESLRDSLQTYRPMFRNSSQAREVESRVHHLLHFLFAQNDLLEKLFQNVCFSLHFFCFLSPEDPLRSHNSSLLSLKILILLINHLSRAKLPKIAEQARTLGLRYWHELQNSLFKTLKVEAAAASGVSLGAFDLERMFGVYSGFGIELLLAVLELANFDSRLVAEFHESLLNSLLTRFLSAKLASPHLHTLARLLRQLLLTCSEPFLVLVGFKLEFFARFRDSLLQIKRDLFEELEDVPSRKGKSPQTKPRKKAQRNVLDAEALFMWVLSALVSRVEQKSADDPEGGSQIAHMPHLVHKNGGGPENESLIGNMRLDESQELSPLSPTHSTALIRSSQNFRILRDFLNIRPRFGTKMRVFVMDNVDRSGRVGRVAKGGMHQKTGRKNKKSDKSVRFKKKKVFLGHLSPKEEMLQIKQKKVKVRKTGASGPQSPEPGRRGRVEGALRKRLRSRRARKQAPFREVLVESVRKKIANKRSRSLKPEPADNNESRLLRMLKQKRSQIFECAVANRHV